MTLQIQGTIEQIRTRLPASVASVEEPPLLGAADPQTGRRLRVELRAERLDWLPPVLASLDQPFIIERPDELRSLVTALADRLAAPPAKVRRTNDRSGTVTWRPEGPSAGRSPAADVADEVLADQDGDADAAEEEDQHPDGIQVGLDKPERADDQPEQDDQGNRSDVSAAHVTVHLWENVERCSRVYPERDGGTHQSVTALQPLSGHAVVGGRVIGAVAHVLAVNPVPARSQMGSSLGFHIILACFGIAFAAVTMTAEWIGIRRGDAAALLLARRWSKIMAVLVAVGAVSGTVLSYEMGLLWPGLMGRFGAAIGFPFSVEGIFFFLEAIFVGVYLYGWRRLPPWAHWWSGMPIVVAGILGAMSVVAANSWMNSPAGYTLSHGKITNVSPVSVFFNASTPYETAHMVLAAYMVTGFLVAGVYAVGLLRGRRDRYHRLGFAVPFTIAGIAAPLQVMMGDIIARFIAHNQPVKFAAMEYVSATTRDAPEWLGGILINGHVYFGAAIPAFDSILVGFSPHTRVIGWDSVPAAQRPPLVTLIHLSFDLMVGIGFFLFALAAWQGWWWWFHRRLLVTAWFLVPAALSGVAAVAAMEAGWVVTEVGRQPWIVYRVMLVSDAVTPSSGVPVTLGVILALYAILTVVSIGVPMIMSRRWRREAPAEEEAEQVPYGPSPARASPSGPPASPAVPRASSGGPGAS